MRLFIFLVALATIHVGTAHIPVEGALRDMIEELKRMRDSRMFDEDQLSTGNDVDVMGYSFRSEDLTADELEEFLTPEVTDQELLEVMNEYNKEYDEVLDFTAHGEQDEAEDALNEPDPPQEPVEYPVDETIPNYIGDKDVGWFDPTKQGIHCYSGFSTKAGVPYALSAPYDQRFFGSVLQITLAGLSVASNVVVLTNALTEGCAATAYPEICDLRDEIEVQLATMEREETELTDKNFQNQKRYVKLRRSMTDNQYILYYTNEDVKAVQSIESLLQDVEDALLDYDYMNRFNESMSGENILTYLFGPIEWTMENIEQMIQTAQNEAYNSITFNIGTRLLALAGNKFIVPWVARSYKKAVGHYKVYDLMHDVDCAGISKAFDDITDANNAAKNAGKIKSGLKDFKQKLNSKFPQVANTMEQMERRFGQAFKLEDSKISPRNVGKELRTKFAASAKSAFGRIKTRYTLLKDKNYSGFFKSFKSFKSWSNKSGWARCKKIGSVVAKAMGAILSAGLDILTIFMDNIKWRDVRNNLQDARDTYTERIEDIRKEKVNATNYSENINKDFVGVSEAFQEIVEEGFKHLLNTTTDIFIIIESGGFENISGIDPNSPIFQDGYYDDITEENIEEKQNVTLHTMEPIKDGFFETSEIFRCMKIYAEDVVTHVNRNSKISYMTEILKGTFRGSISDAAKAFGEQLSARDVLCPVALAARADEEYYDNYKLQPFRTTECKITDQEWEEIKEESIQIRFDTQVKTKLKIKIQNNIAVSFMLDDVIHDFENEDPVDKDLVERARALTEKDILCYVADMTDATYYDRYELKLFRVDDCSTITDAQFEEAKTKRDELAFKEEEVEMLVMMCKRYRSCPCFKTAGISIDEFIVLATGLDPDLPKYCFIEDCYEFKAGDCLDIS